MSAKFENTSLSTQTIPQGYVFSLGSKTPHQVFKRYRIIIIKQVLSICFETKVRARFDQSRPLQGNISIKIEG